MAGLDWLDVWGRQGGIQDDSYVLASATGDIRRHLLKLGNREEEQIQGGEGRVSSAWGLLRCKGQWAALDRMSEINGSGAWERELNKRWHFESKFSA